MEIEPLVFSSGQLQTKITVEVSAPLEDKENTELMKFRSSQTVICRNGQSIVITDLIETVRDNFSSKTPILGDIPIIGSFYKTKKESSRNKDLIVFVTPTSPRLIELENLPENRLDVLEKRSTETDE